MNKIKLVSLKLVGLVRGFFPHLLPSGIESFETFCALVLKTYSLPDLKSYREAIATMVMHLPPTVHRKSLYYFGKSIRKAMANQTAYHFLQKYKEEERALEAESKEALG